MLLSFYFYTLAARITLWVYKMKLVLRYQLNSGAILYFSTSGMALAQSESFQIADLYGVDLSSVVNVKNFESGAILFLTQKSL